MNCKPGDLAVFVRSGAGNEGRVVTCIRLATRKELATYPFDDSEGSVWVIDKCVPTNIGGVVPLAKDAYLRPIRDPGDDAQDETLSWLPVPAEGVTA